jgi:NADPH:quinone reductase
MVDSEMQGWRLKKYGSVDDLELTALPVPVPEVGRVLIKVHAAALNFADGIMIEGKYQVRPATPFVMGAEVAGVVAVTVLQPRFGPGVMPNIVWSTSIGCFISRKAWTSRQRRLFRFPIQRRMSDYPTPYQ